MHKKSRKPPSRKIVLRLPDLDHTKAAVLHSLSSPHSRRNYKFAMEQFITWYCSEPRLALNPAVASPGTSSGTSFGSGPKRRSWTSSLHMIFVAMPNPGLCRIEISVPKMLVGLGSSHASRFGIIWPITGFSKNPRSLSSGW